MSGYVETEIVEANRLTSEEALTRNNENLASWTNVLGDIYDLKAGDKVSLYSAYISERGAGSNKTIEIKGRTLGKSKSFKYISETIESERVTNRKLSAVVEQIEETKQLRDNIANLTIGYYKNTNGTGYTTLPRRFQHIDIGVAQSAEHQVGVISTFGSNPVDLGAILPVPFDLEKPFFIKDDYYVSTYGGAYEAENQSIIRVKNDNAKYTLFISRYSNLGKTTSTLINGGLEGSTEPDDDFTREPEFREYYRYRELLPIEVDKGFNSAQFIAGSLTDKLQLITKTEDIVFSQDPTSLDYTDNCADIHISKIIESNTYKTFNCATWETFSETQYNKNLGESLEPNTWYNNYQVIGMKRPELYETGQFINMNASPTSDRLLGSALRSGLNRVTPNEPLRTNIPYTLENLNTLKAFIDAQELYPEIWESWNAPSGSDPTAFTYGDGTYYNENHTIDNTRFFHINTQSNASQIEIDPVGNMVQTLTRKTNEDTGGLGFKRVTLKIDPNEIVPDLSSAGSYYAVINVPVNPGHAVVVNARIDTSEVGANFPDEWVITLVDNLTDIIVADQDVIITYIPKEKVGGAINLYEAVLNYQALASENSFEIASYIPNFSLTVLKVSIPDANLLNISATAVTTPFGQTVTLSQTFGVDLPAGTPYIISHYTDSELSAYTDDHAMLGSSLLRPTHAGSNDLRRYSKLFLAYFNKADRDVFYDNPSLEKNQLTYGCFGKENFTRDGGVTFEDYINIFPQVSKTAEEPGGPFTMSMPDWVDPDSYDIEEGRKFGYDLHFTAPAQPAIALWDGSQISMMNYDGQTFSENFVLNTFGSTNHEIAFETAFSFTLNNGDSTDSLGTGGGYINRRYIGADNPKIEWDGEHFKISDLHTSENLAARGADGDNYANDIAPTGATKGIFLTAEVPTDEGETIYKLNPLQDVNEFCPALVPYQTQFEMNGRNGSGVTGGAGPFVISDFNKNYQPYTIYDSRSGVFFEDMGYDEDTWDDGLWGIMGFTYAQFNGIANNLLKRVDNTNINSLRFPTTNADIKATNTKNWVTNKSGIPHFGDTLPAPQSYYKYDASGALSGNPAVPNEMNIQMFPPINIKCSSIKLTAERFPVSMIRGYYTIRSDIVPRSIFVGGRDNITNMPIVGVVNKENPQSDYYFGGESGVQFTIGQPMKLSSIKVGIFDPDGSYANVNDSSSVLFKIERQVNTSFNVIEEILAQKK